MNYRALTAKILIDIKAINFNPNNPYTLTSGKKSPVYVDCRKLISYPVERKKVLKFAEKYFINNKIDFDILAGGETAGIPYAAFLSDHLNKPMIYVRKKIKDFGKGSQIEGDFKPSQKAILIEDLATDGKSKIMFVEAMRANKLKITDTFVIFYYDTFKKEELDLTKLGVKIHYLCTWNDILKEVEEKKILDIKDIKIIKKFLFESDSNK